VRGQRGRSREHRRGGRDDDVRRGRAMRVLLAWRRRTKATLTRGAAVTAPTSGATEIHKQGVIRALFLVQHPGMRPIDIFLAAALALLCTKA
jgi:hypothetical protein